MSENINNIVEVTYLTPENAKFTLSENGFLQLTATVKIPESISDLDDKSDRLEDNEPKEFVFERVFLHRAFPFENPTEYIAVFGNFPKTEKELAKEREEKEKAEKEKADKEAKEKEGKTAESAEEKEEKKDAPKENTTSLGDLKEIGIIRDIKLFGETERKYMSDELHRKYFVPVIETIISVKERYGYAYCDIKTNIGRIKFTVHDAHRNILKVSDDRILIADVNGNRYEIASLRALDRNSMRKIELYL